MCSRMFVQVTVQNGRQFQTAKITNERKLMSLALRAAPLKEENI